MFGVPECEVYVLLGGLTCAVREETGWPTQLLAGSGARIRFKLDTTLSRLNFLICTSIPSIVPSLPKSPPLPLPFTSHYFPTFLFLTFPLLPFCPFVSIPPLHYPFTSPFLPLYPFIIISLLYPFYLCCPPLPPLPKPLSLRIPPLTHQLSLLIPSLPWPFLLTNQPNIIHPIFLESSPSSLFISPAFLINLFSIISQLFAFLIFLMK